MINACLKISVSISCVCVFKSQQKKNKSEREILPYPYFVYMCATYCAFVLLSGTKGAHELKGVVRGSLNGSERKRVQPQNCEGHTSFPD